MPSHSHATDYTDECHATVLLWGAVPDACLYCSSSTMRMVLRANPKGQVSEIPHQVLTRIGSRCQQSYAWCATLHRTTQTPMRRIMPSDDHCGRHTPACSNAPFPDAQACSCQPGRCNDGRLPHKESRSPKGRFESLGPTPRQTTAVILICEIASNSKSLLPSQRFPGQAAAGKQLSRQGTP